MLGSSDSCLADISFFPNTNSTFYTIWGIFAMITAIVQIVLALRYGKDGLELIMHFQTLLMLSLSSDNISLARLEYLSWLQIFKLDLGFINPLIRSNLSWTVNSGRLFNAKLYWEDIFHNYFVVFCIIFSLCCIKIIIQISPICKIFSKSNLIQSIVSNSIWVFIQIISPFLISNICIDLLSIAHHTYLSLFTCAFVVLSIALWFQTKLFFLQYAYLK